MNKNFYYLMNSIFLFIFSFMFFLMGLYFMYFNKIYILDWEFLTINSMIFSFSLIFDWMSMFFNFCVFLISSMVLLYSHSYMSNDKNSIRFLYLVLMFILSMFILIMSPNMISILLGWDGLGLISYCLVIYFQNFKSYMAGMLTILINRIGDVAIMLCIAWMLNYGGWHYFYYLNNFNNWGYFLFYMLILASFTKSAQIPFCSWLPAAMAAPTPVSALVHSSTLVTAGVYLLIRFSDYLYMYNCNNFMILSLLTMMMAGIGANFEYDLKKIIALSTLSQLGLMMMTLLLGYPYLSYFHLLTHAFFKALLFLCAGFMIHVMNNNQDIRYMGGLAMHIPFTLSCFFISNLSLCGFPFLSGFYSKDLILEIFSFNNSNFFIYLMMYMSVGLTVSYTLRMMYYILFMYPNSYTCQCYDEDIYMSLSMIMLTLMSVMSGSIFNWLIFSTPVFIILPFFLKMMVIMMIFLGMGMGILMIKINFSMKFFFMSNYNIMYFLTCMWFMPFFSFSISKKSLDLTHFVYSNIDSGWGELIFSKLTFFYLVVLSKLAQFIYYNNMKIYLFSFFLLLFIFIFY